MISEIQRAWGAFQATRGKNLHSLALMEGPTNCNRRCEYCEVPGRWDPEKASTIEQTYQQIDTLYEMGYRVLNYVGGEPLAGGQFEGGVVTGHCAMNQYGCFVLEMDYREKLAPFITKQEITYVEHTLKVVEYASRKGMITNVTTNGDFLDNAYYLYRLKKAGLDILTYSLQSYGEAGLKNIISRARATAQIGIVPIISVVFTADRADSIPQYARICAANGILFSTAAVQEIGGGFSTVPAHSQIPTDEQKRTVFKDLDPFV